MANGYDKMEDIFRQKLENFTEIPSEKVWIGVRKALFFKKITSFKYVAGSRSLSILTVVIAVTISFVTFYLISYNNQSKIKNELSHLEDWKQNPENTTEKDFLIKANEKKIIDTQTVDSIDEDYFFQFNRNVNHSNALSDRGNVVVDSTLLQNKEDFHVINLNSLWPKLIKFNTLKSLTETVILPFNLISLDNSLVRESCLSLAMFNSYNVIQSGITNSSSLPANYLKNKGAIEKSVLYPEIGLEGSWKFKKCFATSGFTYHQAGEEIENKYIQFSLDSVGFFTDTIMKSKWILRWDSNVMRWDSFLFYYTDTVYFTKFDTTLESKTDIIHNKLHYLELPFLIGKEFNLGKFEFRAMGGMSLGFLISSQGKFYDFYSNKLIDYKNNSFNVLNKSVVSLLFHFACAYPINDKASVFIEPACRVNLNSALDKNYPVNQKYWTFGLRSGISIKL